MLDGTCSINNCEMPLYAFLVQEGHGDGQLVGLCLLTGEDSSQMRVKLEMFANANQNIAQTQTFLIDKDFTEIAAIEAVLPSVALQLCTFHCIKAVQKKVSSLQLSSEQNCKKSP